MKRPSLNHTSILEAMSHFDQTLRDAHQWKRWTENRAHQYAIEHDGQLYPVKKIVSLASGEPVGSFSGGRGSGQANRRVREAGFRKIINLHGANPDWLRDELILALNVYLKHRSKLPAKDSEEILGLSRLLNRLGEKLFSPELRADPTFRNPNGVVHETDELPPSGSAIYSDGAKGA